jgi:hypothetical protein
LRFTFAGQTFVGKEVAMQTDYVMRIHGEALHLEPPAPPAPGRGVLRLGVATCCGATAALGEQLKAIAQRIELRLHAGPITKIEIRACGDTQYANVAVTMRVANRDPPHELRDVVVHSATIPCSGVSELAIADLVRWACKFALDHEIDEGIFIADTRAFDPHAADERPVLRDIAEELRALAAREGLQRLEMFERARALFDLPLPRMPSSFAGDDYARFPPQREDFDLARFAAEERSYQAPRVSWPRFSYERRRT